MKAAVVRTGTDKKTLHVEDVPPAAEPGEREVRIEVSFAGICGSDTHGFLNAASTARADGLIMSHEISGRVVDFGTGVSGLRVGDLVTVDPQIHCQDCEACRSGLISICPQKRVLGSSLRGFEQGGMQERITVPDYLVFPVPENVPEWQAALVEPLANAWHVVARAEPRETDTILILGAGPLGVGMLAALQSRRCKRVVVSDPSAFRRDVALAMGADQVLDPTECDVETVIRELTGGAGADIVIESVGVSATYQQALECTRLRGKVMFFGAMGDRVELPLLRILHRELTLIGCTGANEDDTKQVIEALASGAMDIGILPFKSVSLANADDGIRDLVRPNSGIVKLLVSPRSS